MVCVGGSSSQRTDQEGTRNLYFTIWPLQLSNILRPLRKISCAPLHCARRDSAADPDEEINNAQSGQLSSHPYRHPLRL